MNLSRWALDHRPLVGFLLFVLMASGIAAYFNLGQDEDPPFTFRAMVVRAYWPGATARQMADQVTDKFERELQEIPYATKIRSYSKPGETLIILQLADAAPPKEVAGIWYQVRKKIGDIQTTLPSGVIGPFYNDEFGDTYGVIYALSGKGFSPAELKTHADQVRQSLLRVPDVNKVELLGVQDERIWIELSQTKLAQLGLSIAQISDQLNAQNAVTASGVMNLEAGNVWLRVTGALDTIEALEALPLRAGGATIKLGDIARVERGYWDPPRDLMRVGSGPTGARHDGREAQPVIGLGISMTKGGDIIRLGKALEALQPELLAGLPIGVQLEKVGDQPTAVARSVGEFVNTLIEAVVIVLAVSFVALGIHTKPFRIDVRPGLVVLLTIPLVLAVTFLTLDFFGVALHKISLGALIIALGLLVDDAIIAVEMMVRKLEEGWDRYAAATFMYESTAFPMLTGTLITAVGFLPIGMAKSAAGEYTFSIFAVTAAALIFSWFAAVIFVPYLGFTLLRVVPKVSAHGDDLFDAPFYRAFRRLVDACVRFRFVVIAITLALFAAGMFGFKYIEQQFFPDSNRPELMIDLWLPEGSGIAASDQKAKQIEAWLAEQSEVVNFITYVGTGSPRFYLPLDQQLNQSNLAQIVIMPHDLASRDSLRKKALKHLEEAFPDIRARVKLLPSGPPVPYPVQFRVSGADPVQVRALADRVKGVMARNPNLVGLNDNWNEPIKVIRMTLDQAKARAVGVSSSAVMRTLQAAVSGVPIGQFREGERLIDITIRQPKDERALLSRLADIGVQTASGKTVPLAQLVTTELVTEPGVIWRENRDYAITVQADIVDGIQGPTVTMQIDALLKEIRDQAPPGYRIAVAGSVEESKQAQLSIVKNVPLMLFIVLTLLMIQLNSLSRTLLVYLTGPLGLIGASAAMLLFKVPFGFVAQLGVIALLGMIIRNSVILVDQIESDIRSGSDPWTAIVESAVRRFRPIMLTAAAAVLAMIPLSRSVFWGPMAVAIMGGLIVATALTLLFLPALYAAWFRVKRA